MVFVPNFNKGNSPTNSKFCNQFNITSLFFAFNNSQSQLVKAIGHVIAVPFTSILILDTLVLAPHCIRTKGLAFSFHKVTVNDCVHGAVYSRVSSIISSSYINGSNTVIVTEYGINVTL